MQSLLTHNQFSRADRVPPTITAQPQATCREHATAPPSDSVADLWRQLDRTTLGSSRRTLLSNASPFRLPALESQTSLDAVSSSGGLVGHLQEEHQAMNHCQFTSGHPIRISTFSEDMVCDNHFRCPPNSTAQQINILNKSATQDNLISSPALSTWKKEDEEELSQDLRDQQMEVSINLFPYRTTRDHAGRQNTVLKHIRQRKVRKSHLLKPRKGPDGCIVA